MDYSSSYAEGTPRLGQDTRTQPPRAAGVDVVVLPTPRPHRMHWSTMLFIAGMAICLLGLLATIAGVPGEVGYDRDGAPNRNKPTSSDPMALTRSLDGNMKWIDQASSDSKGSYVAYIKSINRSEAAIPAMVQALAAMDASVREIDGGIVEVGATTKAMRADMEAMTRVSSASAKTMEGLGTDIGFLSKSMLALANSTSQLTTRMAGIQRKAAGIASGGTSQALKSTKALNASLPSSIPAPIMSDGTPLALPAAGGGIGVAAGAPAPAPGAQPARPGTDYDSGAAL